MNIFNIERSFLRRKEKGWKVTSWCIDLHDCIFEGNYKQDSEGGDFAPNSIRVLKQLSMRKDFVLTLYTSATHIGIERAMARLNAEGIIFDYVNENPTSSSTELCDFSKKFYFDVLLDDKAGFEKKSDWFYIEAELKRIGQWFEPVTPYVAADMIIEYEGKIVLIDRHYPPLGLAIPGGFVDRGETVRTAAIREAEEETGLIVDDPTWLTYRDDPKRDPRFHVVTHVFYGKGRGTVKAGDDAKGIYLLDKNEDMTKLKFAFPGIFDVMAEYKKRLTN